ncbi:hypothetical protein BGZ83_004264, partial [Gryganskiella cystojenkinii]
TVDDLKVAIKLKKAPEFDNIAADKLILWKVSIPVSDDDDDDEVPIHLNNIPKDEKNKPKKLKATRKLRDIFGDKADENMIHVIVERPQP